MRLTKKQKKGIWRGAVVTAITLLIIISVGFVLALRNDESYYNIKGMYAANIDTLFIGNSHAIVGIDAAAFDDATDAVSYNVATTSQSPLSAQLLVAEAVKTHDLDVVFVETFAMLYPSPQDYYYSKALDADMTVLRSVNSANGKATGMTNQRGIRRIFDALLPLFKYHANWKTPIKWHLRDMDIALMQEAKDTYNKKHVQGYRAVPYVMTKAQSAGYKDFEYNFMVDANMAANAKYWDSLIATCKANGVAVVFVTLPWLPQFVQTTNYADVTTAFDAYFAKHGVVHLDLNQVDLGLTYTDFASEDANPNQHLNTDGAAKTTAYLAAWYKQNFK